MSRPLIEKLIILYLFLSSINCAKKKISIIRFTKITTDFNANNSELVTLGVSPQSNGKSFDVYWKLSRTIPNRLFVGVESLVKINSRFMSIYSYDFDICRVWDGFMSQSIARTWFRNIKKFGNASLALKCPLNKGTYYLKNMDIDSSSVPPFLANGEYMSKIQLYVKTSTLKDMLFNFTLELIIARP